MSHKLGKRSIVKKTVEVGFSTFLSRVLGLAREALMARYLGAGVISDAFITAFKIPNFLRKIFAEGALTASFVPTIVGVFKKDSQDDASRLMTLAFIFFEGVLFALCMVIFVFAWYVIRFIAPGFSLDQVEHAVPFLRILIGFILFVSSSALLAGALNAVNHFFVPAFSPVVLNIFFVSGLVLGLVYGLPVTFLCYVILLGALAQFLMHVYVYFKLKFTFLPINKKALSNFMTLMKRFVPCFMGMSVLELNLFVDTSLASFLEPGSLTRVYYASRFMGIPLGVFAIAFATILLPHFSRVAHYAPKRLGFYLFEASKLIFWVTVPVSLVMSFFSYQIFSTLFVSKKFTIADAVSTQYILIAFTIGLFFFSINKILINMFYALHDTKQPTIITILATLLNVELNIILMQLFSATGLAIATTIGGIFQTALFYFYLRRIHKLPLFLPKLIPFIYRSVLQMVCIMPLFYLVYYAAEMMIMSLSLSMQYYLLETVVFWIWVVPIVGVLFGTLYLTRQLFGLKMYFVE
ncbi:murein biosynthesis integral membrane protein MurJ [bacterium]|jgi:putative peptidoglycan lipid II flippase|nr:murein biosynthesis integral membrane protein MurJ [bacterium]MBT5015022.1 murein biosynthesis integral membrane protein MurJ [bacterium]